MSFCSSIESSDERRHDQHDPAARSSLADWAAAWAASPWPRCWAQDGLLAGTERTPEQPRPRADLNGGLHHRAKVRRVIQLFMNGGVSQMDTFDYKPELHRRHGQPFDPGSHVEAPTSAPGNLMKSPFPFRQYGECGRWVSSVFPEIATCVDDLAFLMALSSKTNVHGPASYMMNTRLLDARVSRAWGRGCRTGWGRSPTTCRRFVVLPDPKGLPYNAKGNFTSGFLPQSHQGTILDAGAPRPIPDLFPPSSAALPHAARASATAGRSSSD